MQRSLLTLSLVFFVARPAAAEEITLKDGTKLVGHMTAVTGDKIEVETAYGKMSFKRADILTISFPENNTSSVPSTPPDKKDAPPVEESLRGTQYVNKTGNFSLSLPPEWKIDPKLPHSAVVVAGLSSRDGMRFLTVSQEEYTGSLESYKGLLDLHYRRNFGNYEELSESSVTIDGKGALLVSFRGTLQKADNLPVQYLVAIIPSGTTYTRVATWCVEPLFHETQPAFERILSSYHSTGPASPSARLSKP